MNLRLSGRTAVVAGGSRGIGLAIVAALHREGCNVAVLARGRETLRSVANRFRDRLTIHSVDLCDMRETEDVARKVQEHWGTIQIVVCNAGSGISVPPGQETGAEWERMIHLNLHSALNVIRAYRPLIRHGGGGSITCVSSICGSAALGAPIGYSAAKAALNAAVRGLARPLADEGIRINAVAPGNIFFEGGVWAKKSAETPDEVADMLKRDVALKRFGLPEEVADLVVFLASPLADFVTGAVYVADGGQLRS